MNEDEWRKMDEQNKGMRQEQIKGKFKEGCCIKCLGSKNETLLIVRVYDWLCNYYFCLSCARKLGINTDQDFEWPPEISAKQFQVAFYP